MFGLEGTGERALRIALYGPFMFEFAAGLRGGTDHEVHLFLDEATLPRSLADESLTKDPAFATVSPWVSRSAILCPRRAAITRALAAYDISVVTELGPVFARYTGNEYVFIPTGWDLKGGPFPLRTARTRPRGRGDLSALLVALRLRSGIRGAAAIWAAPFQPFVDASCRLGTPLDANLAQPIDTALFSPPPKRAKANDTLTIFHPTRMQFDRKRWTSSSGQWKGNDILLRGFADAVERGVDARLVLIERQSSTDQEMGRRLLDDLGVSDRVTWLNAGTPAGFSWRDLAEHYRSADVVVDEFGGWFGLVALEGAACGRPVINRLDATVMDVLYPDGHPFVQASTDREVSDALVRLMDPQVRGIIGDASRDWIMQHHDRGVVATECARRLEVILSKRQGSA